MAAAEISGPDLLSVVVLLAAAVIAVPLFKRLGSARCSATWPRVW